MFVTKTQSVRYSYKFNHKSHIFIIHNLFINHKLSILLIIITKIISHKCSYPTLLHFQHYLHHPNVVATSHHRLFKSTTTSISTSTTTTTIPCTTQPQPPSPPPLPNYNLNIHLQLTTFSLHRSHTAICRVPYLENSQYIIKVENL